MHKKRPKRSERFFRPTRKSSCYNNKRESYTDATLTLAVKTYETYFVNKA